MNVLLIIIFAITLIYLSITERFRIYANLVGLQGLVLFLLSTNHMPDLVSICFKYSLPLVENRKGT